MLGRGLVWCALRALKPHSQTLVHVSFSEPPVAIVSIVFDRNREIDFCQLDFCHLVGFLGWLVGWLVACLLACLLACLPACLLACLLGWWVGRLALSLGCSSLSFWPGGLGAERRSPATGGQAAAAALRFPGRFLRGAGNRRAAAAGGRRPGGVGTPFKGGAKDGKA